METVEVVNQDWTQIIAMAITAVIAIVGFFREKLLADSKAKLGELNGEYNKYAEISKTKIKESQDLFKLVVDAVEDDQVSPEEVKAIAKAAKQLVKFE